MRLLLSFVVALGVALGLFALMLALVSPPRDNRLPDEELARVGFVRSLSDTDTEQRERQRREPPPEPQPPEPPQPPQPPQTEVAPQVELNIALPQLPSAISLDAAPSPSNLEMASVEAPAASAQQSAPGPSEEVTPLVEIPPNYPQRALAAGIEGEVALAFTITAEGRVDNLRVVHAEPPGVFDREARRAAMRWRFTPRREGGQAVAREATKTLYFRLDGSR
ncbi:energy transducer TonB [Halopseudomonas salegens]|uniref:Protein TonB n=1 Tax=Halopseudomonas salegens TaxID=1434072 RepID=A0A1H2EHV4_9GAMM|nr:energy transducer TonB [Halopseudomonas salegens]SDT94318.1 outer membrane transport energization protein TonB [Halopseudomonas salegens]